MIQLESFVEGKWQKGEKPATLFNPSTEEAIAEAGTQGIDFSSALAYAREKGGTSLRGMTFAKRGEVLRAMSRAIHSHRDELIGLAIENGGNTRSDAKFDIDGASGTLAAYADLGASLGETDLLVDGDAIQLGRSARLFGQHVRVTRRGVAVHINAFNFPAWGLAEKAATALLAGMPVVTKPATSTALVSHRMMKIFVDEKIMPEGTLSFVCGSAGNMLDFLSGQDVLAFTGGSATGATLRGGKRVVEDAVRMNVEADSLNAAILGPDVAEGSDTLHLFVADVVRDMTQKTGQKCTAIRRIYVPSDKVESVVALLSDRLAGVRMGNPANEETTMGPLATAQQLRDVKSGVERLLTCSKVAFGEQSHAGKGYFFSPMLLLNQKPQSGDAVHSHEVFGPVATIMPYDGSATHAATLVSFGCGGLVSSVYSDDKSFVREVVLGVAPFHGRVTIGSEKIAAQAIPPGLVLPQLVHGGPGRAGGGEELGGERGLHFYMQRTALQGDRALLETIAGKR